MLKNGFSPQSGKSLVEIIIVLAIAAVLVTFAVAQFGKTGDFFQRQNFSRELKVNLERARFDSIKRRAEGAVENLSRVIITSATSFTVVMDLNQNGTLESGETRTTNFNTKSGIKFVGNLIYPITLSFDRHGHIYATDGIGAIVPTFTICDNNCTVETVSSSNSDRISISPSGTVAMLKGGESLPNFNSPNVSTVSYVSEVNPWVSVSNDSTVEAPNPTPAPTASASPSTTTPIPTPSVTPVSTPTTTPISTPQTTPTPQASPTPKACALNERPAQTGCQCLLPKTVKPSGKCQ